MKGLLSIFLVKNRGGTPGYGKEKVEEGRNNWLWERAVGKKEQEGVEIFSIFNYSVVICYF